MHKPVVKVDGVSKKYCQTLRHTMSYGVKDLACSFFGISQQSEQLRLGEFWAVNDVSFEVKRGETVGIIGANGSGKSTLLKLLNGIFMPDKGRIEIKGRLGALIEVGAGFHPMLTGRENVYVNGSIFGMSKKEIDKKFDEIVDFAGIGDFIDSPVKHYSSGMYVRLGFAVAVHCDLDILLIDEVLAVGDAKFQNKCYEKLLEFKSSDRTIIFVAHDMRAIVRHCDYAVLLEKGTILERGNPNDVVNHYHKLLFMDTLLAGKSQISRNSFSPQKISAVKVSVATQSQLDKFLEEIPVFDNCANRNSYNKNEYRFGDGRAEIIDYLIVYGESYDPVKINSGDMVNIYVKYKFHQDVESPMFGFAIKTIDAILVYGNNTSLSKIKIQSTNKFDLIVIKWSIYLGLNHGDYFIDLGVGEYSTGESLALDRRYNIIHLSVQTTRNFTGIVGFETDVQEISRSSCDLHRQSRP